MTAGVGNKVRVALPDPYGSKNVTRNVRATVTAIHIDKHGSRYEVICDDPIEVNESQLVGLS